MLVPGSTPLPGEVSPGGAAPVRRTRRPRDRKAHIVAAAGRLFCVHGYHNVGTEDIAEAVGVTAGALYRHFDSKQDMLAHAVNSSFERAVDEVQKRRADGLTGLVEGLVQTAVDRRGVGVLWTRESRNLDDVHLSAMRGQFFALVEMLTQELRQLRPELYPADAELLVWALLAVLTSPSYHSTPLSSGPLAEVMRAMASAVAAAPFPGPAPDIVPAREEAGLLPRSRRERLLVVSTRLFARRGFQAVSMSDIGAAAGVSAGAVYRHFDTKADLLVHGLTRAVDPLRLGLCHALEQASTPVEGRAAMVASHVEFALRHTDVLQLLLTEMVAVQGPARLQVRSAQREYVAEWVGLLRESRDVDSRRARFLVHGALTLISDGARTAVLRRRPDLGARLGELALRVLDA